MEEKEWEWHQRALGEKAVNALIKNEFAAVYVPTRAEAADLIMQHVHPDTTVGFGGSMTIKHMGMQEKVEAAGGKVLDHGEVTDPAEMIRVARAEMQSDLYLCSSNAVTLDGALVNVDAMGNRIAAMTFGPKKVIVVVSVDKVCSDEAAAFERMKAFAAPMNNKRLERPGLVNPCAKTGVCANCQSKTRLCRIYSVMRRRPSATDLTVILVGEKCGF